MDTYFDFSRCSPVLAAPRSPLPIPSSSVRRRSFALQMCYAVNAAGVHRAAELGEPMDVRSSSSPSGSVTLCHLAVELACGRPRGARNAAEAAWED